MTVSKRLRFEILRRDNHACRYCGGTAPDAVLTVDHVVPVTLGGQDVPENLVTACRDCNAGKSASTADAELVANVAEDAIRWRKAMEIAQRLADDERDVTDAFCDEFKRHWDTWGWTIPNYRSGTGKPEWGTCDLPGGWRTKVSDLMSQGLSTADCREAIDLTMGSRHVKDEFAYFLAIARSKVGERQAVAQALLRRGDV